MSIVYKCKMCGGRIDVVDGNDYVECPFCGVKQQIVEQKNESAEEPQTESGYSKEEDALLTRALMFSYEFNWAKIIEYCDKTLDVNPRNAKAWLLKALAENQCDSTKDLAIKKYYEDKNFSTSFLYARQYADENTKEDIEAYDKAVAEYPLQILKEYEEFCEQNEVGDTIEDSIYKETSVISYLRRRVCDCDHYIINVHDDGIPVPPHEIDSKHQFYYNKTEQILVQQRNVDRVVDFHGDYVLLYLNGAVRTLLKCDYNEEMNSWNGVKELYSCSVEIKKDVYDTIICAIFWDGNVKCRVYDNEDENRRSPLQNKLNEELDKWYGIDRLSFHRRYIIGYRCDGKIEVLSLWDEEDEEEIGIVKGWDNIKSVIKRYNWIGLKNDGTVVTTGKSHKVEDEIVNWKNIAQIEELDGVFVALTKYGNMICTHNYTILNNRLSDWKNICYFEMYIEEKDYHYYDHNDLEILARDKDGKIFATRTGHNFLTVIKCGYRALPVESDGGLSFLLNESRDINGETIISSGKGLAYRTKKNFADFDKFKASAIRYYDKVKANNATMLKRLPKMAAYKEYYKERQPKREEYFNERLKPINDEYNKKVNELKDTGNGQIDRFNELSTTLNNIKKDNSMIGKLTVKARQKEIEAELKEYGSINQIKANYNAGVEQQKKIRQAAIDELRKEVNEKIPLLPIDDFEL